MQTGTFEYALENNPLRTIVRDVFEVQCLRRATTIKKIENALHIACGNGDATQLLLKHFDIERLSGTDRDPEVIKDATVKYAEDKYSFSVQDVDGLRFQDDSFDAVFDLADLHNVRYWRRGIAEIKRVLKPNGILLLEELTKDSFTYGIGNIFRKKTEHPYDSMFSTIDLYNELANSGFRILFFKEKNMLRVFKYVIIIAEKSSI